jgi:hypothetical protein
MVALPGDDSFDDYADNHSQSQTDTTRMQCLKNMAETAIDDCRQTKRNEFLNRVSQVRILSYQSTFSDITMFCLCTHFFRVSCQLMVDVPDIGMAILNLSCATGRGSEKYSDWLRQPTGRSFLNACALG